MTQDSASPPVTVHPLAFVTMALHAARHSSSSVHGLLLGKIETDGAVEVQDAVPVSHGAPTRPLVETAMGLLPSDRTIVGWYTAPELLSDTRPGPVALRMVASMANSNSEDDEDSKKDPALIVLHNANLAACLKGTAEADSAMAAFGRDFGQQWLEPLKLSVDSGTGKACVEAYKQKVAVVDLIDHLENTDEKPSSWYPNGALHKVVEQLCPDGI